MYSKYAPPVSEIKKWISALRSGKFQQTQGVLQDRDGYCCLGVACQIFSPKHQLERNGQYLRGSMPSDQRHAPTWLKRVANDFARATKIVHEDGDNEVTGLIDMNDEENFSFDEIADMLQLVYVEKAFA
jgi:hypothetical protein